MSLTTKVKVVKFSFLKEKSYNKTFIDFNLADIRIYQPLKVMQQKQTNKTYSGSYISDARRRSTFRQLDVIHLK